MCSWQGRKRRRRCLRSPRHHLWLQIYVAFVAVIVSCFLVSAASTRLLYEERKEAPAALAATAAFITADLPAGDQLQDALTRRAEELRLRLALWSPDGAPLASTWGGLPGPYSDCDAMSWIHTAEGPGVLVALPDGRWLSATLDGRVQDRWRQHLLVLGLLMATMAIGSYGITRRITRRLEALQQGVRTLGEGELSARVVIGGTDEVAHLARTFNTTAARIEALVDNQKRILASASHELRSPLARVRMALEILADAEHPSERRRWRAEAEADIAELDSLIEDLLLASRLEGAPRGPLETVDLRALLGEEAAREGVAAEGEAALIRGEPRMLRTALRNLLINARIHGSGEIVARVTPHKGGYRLVIADRGPGVPAEQAERIFEPFTRLDGGKPGAGLGLSLVRRIIARHGGSVRVLPREGGGARFELDLPTQES